MDIVALTAALTAGGFGSGRRLRVRERSEKRGNGRGRGKGKERIAVRRGRGMTEVRIPKPSTRRSNRARAGAVMMGSMWKHENAGDAIRKVT